MPGASPSGLHPGDQMNKKEAIERLKKLLEEGRVVIPTRFPLEDVSWTPESDASRALKYALGE